MLSPSTKHQHREGEEVEVEEELREVLVAVHVADRVQVDQCADAGDEQAHRDGQRIDEEPDVDRERPPARNHANRVCENRRSSPARSIRPKNTNTVDDERTAHHDRREPAGERLAELRPNSTSTKNPASGKAGINQTTSSMRSSSLQHRDVVGSGVRTAAQDRHDDSEADDHFAPRPRPARRTRRSGRPRSFSFLPSATNVRLTALSINSTHMNITSGLRRVSKPNVPTREQRRAEDQIPRRW